MQILKKTLLAMVGAGLLCLITACSSPDLKKAADQDVDDKSYMTGSRIPRKGAQPVGVTDKSFAEEALRQQRASQLGSTK